MRDNVLGQTLRWGLAGWVFFGEIWFFLFCLSEFVYHERIETLFEPGLAGILALLGVPFGYLVYQFYYHFYWVFPYWYKRGEWSEKKAKGKLGREHPEKEIVDRKYYQIQKKFDPSPDIYSSWINTIARHRFTRVAFFILTLFYPQSIFYGPTEKIEMRRKWSYLRSAWYRSLEESGEQRAIIEPVSSRFEYLSSSFDALGSIYTANALVLPVILIASYFMCAVLAFDIEGSGQKLQGDIGCSIIIVLSLYISFRLFYAVYRYLTVRKEYMQEIDNHVFKAKVIGDNEKTEYREKSHEEQHANRDFYKLSLDIRNILRIIIASVFLFLFIWFMQEWINGSLSVNVPEIVFILGTLTLTALISHIVLQNRCLLRMSLYVLYDNVANLESDLPLSKKGV
jgi:hypothetical protein